MALIRYGPDHAQSGVGVRAPDARVVDLGTSDTVSLRQRYKGQVTLVNIWATWCIPCKVEMPSMQQLYDSLGSRGLKIPAVRVHERDPRGFRNFGAQLHLTFDVLHDRSTRIEQTFQTTGVPES